MIFEPDFQSLQLLDVIMIDQQHVRAANHGRKFSALSFRLRSDACLKTSKEFHQMTDGSISFVPRNLDYERVAGTDRMIVIHFNTIGYTEKNIEVFLPPNPNQMQTLFEKILLCWQQKDSGYRYRCHSLLYEIFALCHSHTSTSRKPSKIEAGVSYIQSHWDDPSLTIAQAANEANMSEVYFRRLFYREFGTTPKRFLIDLRLQNAVSLMDTGYFSLQEIAAKCGYADYKYFSVEFKRHKGCSPSEYMYQFNHTT